MSEGRVVPPPTYSTWPLWAATVAYLLNLAVVVGLAASVLDPGVGLGFTAGIYLGSFVAVLTAALMWRLTTRFRSTGLVAWAAPALAVVLTAMIATDSRGPVLGALAGFLACVGLIPTYWYVGSFPDRDLLFAVQTRILMPKVVAIISTGIAAMSSAFLVFGNVALVAAECWIAALVATILLALWGWGTLQRGATEIFFELTLGVCYAVRGGPAHRMPAIGPVLVIANHACWFDPLFVSKVLPRPGTPMMTAKFYSVWFIKPLLKYIFRVIVVPESPMRREAPELKLAVAALDRGECVMIFPEGYLRRKEEVPMRRFGQGVWQILKERPETPVVACWVEGGWGAWCSYYNGPPAKNKRMDFRRRIRVALSEAEVVPPELLADHLATRIHLMNRVRAMRVTLGLPDLPSVELPGRTDGVEAAE